MIEGAARRLRAESDVWLAGASVGLLGCATVLALAAGAAGTMPLAVAAAAVGGAALVLLLAAEWLDGMVFLALMLPLPAIYSTASVRISAAVLATPIVVFAWMIAGSAFQRKIRLGSLPRTPTLMLLGAVVVATIFAENRLLAVRELVNWTLFLTLLFAATDHLLARPARIRSLALAVATVTAVTGAFAVMESAGFLPGRFTLSGTGFNRATVGFGWPNELGVFLAMGIPFSVYAVQSARGTGWRTVAIAGLTASVLGLTATFSRGSWLGLVGASAVLVLVGERGLVLRIWLGVLVAAGVVELLSGGAFQDRVLGIATDPYVVQRAALTFTGLLIFQAHLVTGVGPGGFVEALDEFGPQVTWLWDYVGSAHNAYVDVAAEMGLIGLIGFIAFLGATLFVLLRGARRVRDQPERGSDEIHLRHALLWSFATVCLVGFAAWPFAHGLGQMVMFVAAMGFALDGWSEASHGQR